MSQARKSSAPPRFAVTLDWVTRPVFGVLLAASAVGATALGGVWFALFIAAAVAAAAREWHRMFAAAFVPYMIITIIVVVASLAAISRAIAVPDTFPWVVLMAGTIATFALATARKAEPAWQAFGVLYLGISAVAMVTLRMNAPHAFWLVVTLFATVWATDTGALFTGNLLGGPKLVPVLSPNKTWAGFFGGIVCAAVTGALIVAAIRGDVMRGALFGIGVALASHLGDLFESWVKRRVGRKNSGSLIPGHGGVLDRIDSIILAAPLCALAVFAFGLDPLLGVNP